MLGLSMFDTLFSHMGDDYDIIMDPVTEEPREDNNSIKKKDIQGNKQDAIMEALKYACMDPKTGFNCKENIYFSDDEDTIKNAFERARSNPKEKEMIFCQENSLGKSKVPKTTSEIEENGLNINAIGETQSGKTLGSWYLMYFMAVCHDILPVLYSMNRTPELDRFAMNAGKFNDFIKNLMKILEIEDDGSIFMFSSVHDDEENTFWRKNVLRKKLSSSKKQREYDVSNGFYNFIYSNAMIRWRENKSIPVVVTLSNPHRFDNFIKKIVPTLVRFKYFIRNSDGDHLKIFVVCDEADQLRNTEDDSTTIFFGKEFIVETEHSMSDLRFSSLYSAPIVLMNSTATPQALAIKYNESWRKQIKPIMMEPSINYYGYLKYSYQLWSVIRRIYCDTWEAMIQNMCTTRFTESALVYVKSTVAQKSYCREAAIHFDKIFSVAWEGSSVYIATANMFYVDILRQSENVIKTASEIFDDFIIPDDMKTLFKEERKVDKKTNTVYYVFESCKNNYVNSYPRLMELFAKLTENMDGVHKTVLFAGAMANRGTPIKSCINHLFGLTCMFAKEFVSAEFNIQLFGRLCGIVPGSYLKEKRQNKFLYAPKNVHDAHRNALKRVPVFRYLLEHDISVKDAFTTIARGEAHSEQVRAVLGALMKGKKDTRDCIGKCSHEKRKREGYETFEVPGQEEFSKEPNTKKAKKFNGPIVDSDSDGCEKFSKRIKDKLKVIFLYAKRVNDFIVVSDIELSGLLEKAVSDPDIACICFNDVKPEGRKNYVEVKISKANGRENKCVLVKFNGDPRKSIIDSLSKKFKTQSQAVQVHPHEKMTEKQKCWIEFIHKYLEMNGESHRTEIIAAFENDKSKPGIKYWGKDKWEKRGNTMITGFLEGLKRRGFLSKHNIGVKKIRNEQVFFKI